MEWLHPTSKGQANAPKTYPKLQTIFPLYFYPSFFPCLGKNTSFKRQNGVSVSRLRFVFQETQHRWPLRANSAEPLRRQQRRPKSTFPSLSLALKKSVSLRENIDRMVNFYLLIACFHWPTGDFGKSRIVGVSLGKMALQKFKSMDIGYVLTGEQCVAFSLKFLVHPNQSFVCLFKA